MAIQNFSDQTMGLLAQPFDVREPFAGLGQTPDCANEHLGGDQMDRAVRVEIAIGAHHAALNTNEKEPMQGHEGRIRDLESDSQTLTARLDETARALRDLRWAESGVVEDLARELRTQVTELREFEKAGRDRSEKISGAIIMFAEATRKRIDKLTTGLLALGAISFVEGVAIIALWWRR
jgi:hypothetical protein